MTIKKNLYLIVSSLIIFYPSYLCSAFNPKALRSADSSVNKDDIKKLREIFANDDLRELKKFIEKYPNFDFTQKNTATSLNSVTNQEESETILPGHPIAAGAYKCLLYLIEQHKIPEKFIDSFETINPEIKDKIQKEFLNIKQRLAKNKISLDSAAFERYLKTDNLQDFKELLENFLPVDILRHAASLNAKKIVRFILDSGLFDINKDPATLTWFALKKPQYFNDLVNKLQPSQTTKDHALQLLENDFFGNEMPKAQYDSAKKLLLQAGAEPIAINPISIPKV